MLSVQVIYDYEPEGWSAESPDRPRWTAFGESFEEVRELAHEGLPFFFGEEVFIEEVLTDRAADHLPEGIGYSIEPETGVRQAPGPIGFPTTSVGQIIRSHGAVKAGV